MFHRDMTVSQFILALEKHNAEVLNCIQADENYSELLQQFRDSKVLERDELKSAFDVFNLTQPEFYIEDTNYTSEIQQLLNEDYWGTADVAYQINHQIEKLKTDTYACYLENYDVEYNYFEGIIKSSSSISNKTEYLDRLKAYRELCKDWKRELSKDLFRQKTLSEINLFSNEIINQLIDLRSDFAPRYMMDLTENGMENDEIYTLVENLENLDTFEDRVNYLKRRLKGTNNQNGHLFAIKDRQTGKLGTFLQNTLKTDDSQRKLYRNGKLPLSDASRKFLIAIFFYLSLPFDVFEDFLAYHGYGLSPNLPLITNGTSTKNKNYTEVSNIYYEDIKELSDSGLSYNTLLTVLFGNTTYRVRE